MAFKRPTVRSRSAPPFDLSIRSFPDLQPKGQSGRIDRPTVGIELVVPHRLAPSSIPFSSTNENERYCLESPLKNSSRIISSRILP
jgi:hypothetical protein